MNSRSVSFVERLELEFSGNHFGHAMSLGDVDGDGVIHTANLIINCSLLIAE
jgi:hypothetical protein